MNYSNNEILKSSYFKSLKVNTIFDSLTGAVSREYSLGFIKSLMDSKTPYCLHLVDIDNFKLVNDELGHKAGDDILKRIVLALQEATMDKSIIGRYGGDEFLIITPNMSEYNDIWKFTKNIFDTIRRNKIPSVFGNTITITGGAASYPKDFVEFEQLFLKVDKALYRGKQKGRNCFIIYDEEKHKNIDVSNSNEKLTDVFDHIYSLIMTSAPLNERISDACKYISDIYNISFYIIGDDNNITTLYSKDHLQLPKMESAYNNNILKNKNSYLINDYSSLKDMDMKFHTYCWDNNIKALASFKLNAYGVNYGSLFIVHYHMKRIWQREDKILFSYLSKILALVLYNEKK